MTPTSEEKGWHSVEFVKDLQGHIATLTEQNAKLKAENTMLAEDRDHMSQRFTPLMQENRKLREELKRFESVYAMFHEAESGREQNNILKSYLKSIRSLLEESKPLNS